MKQISIVLLCITAGAALTAHTQVAKTSAEIALVGGTIIDVSNEGRSTHDLPNAVVLLRNGKIEKTGPASTTTVPKSATKIDCTGKFLLPGLIDGFAGLNSQAQANATLYMGVTSIVGSQDDRRGLLKFDANPSPHIYPLDDVGITDDYSLLIHDPAWATKLKDGDVTVELSREDTKAQIAATARRGTRAIWLGHELTAANTKFIIEESHRLGMVTYGEFISTPYAEGIADGADLLLHMTRYELGLVSDDWIEPLKTKPNGPEERAAYAAVLKVDPTDPKITAYANRIKAAHVALMPTLSLEYLILPNHRNLWQEPAAAILDPKGLHSPPNPTTGEMDFPSEAVRDRMTNRMAKLWAINRTIQAAHPLYLAASGTSALGSMPGISMHVELELLVRLGLTPREAFAAATSNYADRFNWKEVGQIEPGRRADILILDADPIADITNSRKINAVILEGTTIDRPALLTLPH